MRTGVVRNDPVRFFMHFEGLLGGCGGGLGWLVDGGTPQKIEKAMCIPRVLVNKIYRYEIGSWGGEPLTFRFFEPLSHTKPILGAVEKGKYMRPMPKLEVTELPVDELVPYANNAKEHPQKQIDEIAESISTFGNCDPIGVWHNEAGEPEIVEGHGRVLALKKLGITIAPVIYLDHLTDEQRRAYTHVHNQTTMSSGFDYETLVADMDNLNMDWEALGFEEFCFNENLPSVDEAADELPETVICKCKRGDIWQLGNHRVMCGDATNSDDIKMLLGGAMPDMVFTDPPYGYKYNSGHNPNTKMLLNDDIILDYVSAVAPYLNDCAVYSFCGWQSVHEWVSYFKKTSLKLKNMIIWKKNNWSMGDLECAYAGQYEICLYLNSGKKKLNGHRDTDVWEFDRTPPTLHPTMKPVSLIQYALEKSSQSGDNVLDVFGGSGSTLIACERLNRNCYMMELDEHYCDVIIQRWEEATGNEAVRLD